MYAGSYPGKPFEPTGSELKIGSAESHCVPGVATRPGM